MKTAGVVFDFYDDLTGALLKEVFPSPGDLPEIIKTAHILNPEERGILRDEAFGLVMQNEGSILRKFACVDAGNTLLSLLYFEKTAAWLPEEARLAAAEALHSKGLEFGLIREKTSAKKDGPRSSTGMSRTRDSMLQPLVGDEADWANRTNILSVRGGADSGRVLPTVNQTKTAEAIGKAETLTTDRRDVSTKTTNPMVQNRKVPIVDVTGKDPAQAPQKGGVEKKASRYALGDRYALDSMADVAKAVDYWSQNYVDLDPSQRREYAVKTAARAEELGIEIDELMARYAGSDYATDVDAHLATRRAVTSDDNHEMFDALREKRANIEPEVFAELLGNADAVAGLDAYYGGQVQDPYFSTFGDHREQTKVAHWSWQGRVGDYVTGEQLHKMARNGRELMRKHFDKDLTDAFCKSPIPIFESLPDDSKAIVARLAADEYDGLKSN